MGSKSKNTNGTAPRITTMMRRDAHRQAEVALAIDPNQGTMIDFVSEAVATKAAPILRKHNLNPDNLPAKR